MRRMGLTLLELIVVIAVLAILMALLLPAIQYSRESARRIQCSSNLRQIAIATHHYESQHRCFPLGNANSYSYLVVLLPHLEMGPLFQRVDFAQHFQVPDALRRAEISHFKCPTDETSFSRSLATNYAGNMGCDMQVNGFNGIFSPVTVEDPDPFLRGQFIRIADVSDGLSGTAMVGETLAGDGRLSRLRTIWGMAQQFPAGEHDQFVQACLGQQFLTWPNGTAFGVDRGAPWTEGSGRSTLYSHALTPNQLSCYNGALYFGAFTLTSQHADGVNVAYADGHLQFISDSIDLHVWRASGTRAGHEPGF